MKSELSPEKFHEKLMKLTAPEKVIALFTHYDFSGKPFNGTFTDETFELTKNSPWQHIKAMRIKGTYKKNDDNKTEVTFEVGVSKKFKVFSRILLIVILFAINALLIFSNNNLESSIFLVLNGWVILMFLFSAAIIAFSRFVVNQKFKHEFQIDIKPTDLYGYGGE